MNPKFARIIIQELLKDQNVFSRLHEEFTKYNWDNPRLRGSNSILELDWKNDSRLKLHPTVECNGEILFNTASGNIEIGEYSFFGQRVMVIAGSHDISKKLFDRKYGVPKTGYDISIGKGVFIGAGSIVIGPCTIGDHAVIAAGSVVVSGTYEGSCLYAGNPAIFKKQIKFSE
jgi:acetyltransferase-like isoleucine patch superfamily enzyme